VTKFERLNFLQLELAKTIIESIKTKELSEPKESGLLTLEDLYPHVTEKQKSDSLEQFSVSNFILHSSAIINPFYLFFSRRTDNMH
jgi:hypothetical protein